jgi:hypothetical protein
VLVPIGIYPAYHANARSGCWWQTPAMEVEEGKDQLRIAFSAHRRCSLAKPKV